MHKNMRAFKLNRIRSTDRAWPNQTGEVYSINHWDKSIQVICRNKLWINLIK